MTTNDSKVPERDEGHKNGGGTPDSIEKHLEVKSEDTGLILSTKMDDLDEVVPSLVLEFFPTNFMNTRLKATFPSHEFDHPNPSKDLIH